MHRHKIRVKVVGEEYIPRRGPAVIVLNHYNRPGFGAWWLAFAVSSVMIGPIDIHWTISGAFTSYKRWYSWVINPLSHWVFPRVAKVFGFTAMPPMPPDPHQVEDRAKAVRQVLMFARENARPVIGLSPEGQDFPGAVLHSPSPGTGRFMLHLGRFGMKYYPVGVYEEDDCLVLHFGSPYLLSVPGYFSSDLADQQASQIVMRSLAELLPVELQGEYRI